MEVTIMNIKRTLLNTALVLVTAATLAACSQDSEDKVEDAMSSAGDTVEQTMDDAGDALNSAGNSMEDTMTDAGNAVEDTCEDIKEGTNAKDTDC
jgi:hypothetical protein|tara:strand:- start:1175 stop:1459 length:285 start_codon:yes stop_codon:yes gene_type:complete